MDMTMQAIGFRRYGPADVLEPLTLPRPALAPDAVLVHVAAAGVNPADWRLRDGQFKRVMRLQLPFIPGSDIAGVVSAVGSAVTRFQPGDRVYAMLPLAQGGGYAEYATVPEQQLAAAPATITLAEAAAMPLAGLTALQALRDRARLRSGEHVLIYGASGGVGTFAVQIAKAFGARVTAVCSGRNATLVRGLGADAVRDYTQEDVAAGAERYDLVFDTVYRHKFRAWKGALTQQGRLVTVNPLLENGTIGWLAERIAGYPVTGLVVRPGGADLAELAKLISTGQVRPVIERTFTLAEASLAQQHSATERTRGKLVLIVHPVLAS
ncbi:MAG: NAD(P)-dependent alcohol dehydrogenase [Chloroflexaceae bacterium]|nr:NAD(P)-dependent alcohol dehydrogenase [Chloroflexaceae bacterium]